MRQATMTTRLAGLVLVALSLSVGTLSAAAPDAAGIINGYFAKQRGYQRGDLISQADWAPIAKLLAEAGFEVKEPTAIQAALLPENDYLVQQSHTKSGREFFRQSGRYPRGYDQLDHLSRLSDGHRIIWRLANNGPEGYKLIQYMATSPGGAEMCKMLTVDPGGKDFDKPTGRIYTADQLIERLTGKSTTPTREERLRAIQY